MLFTNLGPVSFYVFKTAITSMSHDPSEIMLIWRKKNKYFFLLMLKTVVLLNISVKTMTYFSGSFDKSLKEQHLSFSFC